MEQMTIDLTQVLIAIITLITAILTKVIYPLIKAKIGEAKFYQLYQYVKIAVKAAEQIYNTTDPDGNKGQAKKQYVKDFLLSKGYDINLEEIDAMIEAAVLEINLYEI